MGNIDPKNLVCIFAHPDDEAFGPGGAIAKYAKICPVHIICATDCDGGGNAGIGMVRRNELQNSAKILGIRSVTFLGIGDGTLCNNNYHEVAEKIKSKLTVLHPDTLMTFDPNGVSGHLDHIALSMIVTYLFEKSESIDTLLYFSTGDYFKPLMSDYFVYVPPGNGPEMIDLKLDVHEELATKIAAMKEHVSQKKDCDMILRMFHNHLDEELFRVLKK